MPTRIDWADETVNPLGHGCYGPGGTKENPKICPYCYAYKQAKRGMRGCELCKQFIPHTHFEQLEKLKQWKQPKKIFMQSMGDLFHDSIPDSWIQQVFAACKAAPWHQYLFLTKNPYSEFFATFSGVAPKAKNYWYGTTITGTEDDMYAPFCGWDSTNTFISIEPLLAPIPLLTIPMRGIKWIIVGSETGNRKGKIVPKKEWVQEIVMQCKNTCVPVFMKESLRGIMGSDFVQQWPAGLETTR